MKELKDTEAVFLLAQTKDKVSTVIHVQARIEMSVLPSKSRSKSLVGVTEGSRVLAMSISQSMACWLEGQTKEWFMILSTVFELQWVHIGELTNLLVLVSHPAFRCRS